MEGLEESYDNGLKLFLDKDEMERLYDFEEDCVEGYFAEQENKLQQSTEERIKITTERIEHLTQKVEDIITKENLQTTVLQNLDVRTRRYTDQLQELTNEVDTVKQLLLQNQMYPPDSIIAAQQGMRQRTISEQSELSEDNTIIGHLLPQAVPSHRKKTVVRSLTEVRPDAYIFDNGQHIEYRYADEDDETEQLDNISAAGSRQHLNLLRQRTKSTESKESSESEKRNDELSVDDVAGFNSDILRARALQKRRDSTGTIRRGSESGNGSRKRNPSEMSNPEIALNFEKEHLRSAEESDYMVMENLIQRRYSEEDEEIDDDVIERPSNRNPTLLSVVTETREFRVNSWPVRNALLKRSTAVEEPQVPIGHLGNVRSMLLPIYYRGYQKVELITEDKDVFL